MAKSTVVQVAQNFWNIRGSFKIGFVADIGTHASLVRLKNGSMVFLDSYAFNKDQKKEIDALTNGGRDVAAILNVHPFHTVHVAAMHEMYPAAKLYGTARHLEKFPHLPWQPDLLEDKATHKQFTKDFEFSVPRGVDFISSNENIHFSSVLVYHKSSKTIHVDDTLMYVKPPILKKWLELPAALSFHPTLVAALERRAGAAQEFTEWAEELIERWEPANNLCAAHTASLLTEQNRGARISRRIKKALRNVKPILAVHRKLYG